MPEMLVVIPVDAEEDVGLLADEADDLVIGAVLVLGAGSGPPIG